MAEATIGSWDWGAAFSEDDFVRVVGPMLVGGFDLSKSKLAVPGNPAESMRAILQAAQGENMQSLGLTHNKIGNFTLVVCGLSTGRDWLYATSFETAYTGYESLTDELNAQLIAAPEAIKLPNDCTLTVPILHGQLSVERALEALLKHIPVTREIAVPPSRQDSTAWGMLTVVNPKDEAKILKAKPGSKALVPKTPKTYGLSRGKFTIAQSGSLAQYASLMLKPIRVPIPGTKDAYEEGKVGIYECKGSTIYVRAIPVDRGEQHKLLVEVANTHSPFIVAARPMTLEQYRDAQAMLAALAKDLGELGEL